MRAVPTPFNHFVLAERVLGAPDLPQSIKARLQSQRPAFLLGNTAPDLGSLTDHRRPDTHFFTVPMLDRHPAHLRLLARHPGLVAPKALAPAHAAFVAGYLAHLWLDQLWIRSIFEPFFGPRASGGGSFHDRLIGHNLLRAHLDSLDRGRLPSGLGDILGRVRPQGWLPFAADEQIDRWRDHLSEQLFPDGAALTTEVFASRLGIAAERFASMLEAPEQMEQRVFGRLPADLVDHYWNRGLAQTVELVQYYYQGRATGAPATSRPVPRVRVSLEARTGEYHESHRTV